MDHDKKTGTGRTGPVVDRLSQIGLIPAMPSPEPSAPLLGRDDPLRSTRKIATTSNRFALEIKAI